MNIFNKPLLVPLKNIYVYIHVYAVNLTQWKCANNIKYN